MSRTDRVGDLGDGRDCQHNVIAVGKLLQVSFSLFLQRQIRFSVYYLEIESFRKITQVVSTRRPSRVEKSTKSRS